MPCCKWRWHACIFKTFLQDIYYDFAGFQLILKTYVYLAWLWKTERLAACHSSPNRRQSWDFGCFRVKEKPRFSRLFQFVLHLNSNSVSMVACKTVFVGRMSSKMFVIMSVTFRQKFYKILNTAVIHSAWSCLQLHVAAWLPRCSYWHTFRFVSESWLEYEVIEETVWRNFWSKNFLF